MRHMFATLLDLIPVRFAAALLVLFGIGLLIYAHYNPHAWNADQHRAVAIGAIVLAVVVVTLWRRVLAWIAFGPRFWPVVFALALATLLTGSVAKADVIAFTGIPTVQGVSHYAGIIDAAARRHGLPPALLRALAHCESNYNPHALSEKGASGLFQLMPKTARRYRVRNPRDPHDAAAGAARYLADLYHEFGSFELAVAAYNAGERAVRRHGGVPPYNETKLFVSRVMGAYYTATQKGTQP